MVSSSDFSSGKLYREHQLSYLYTNVQPMETATEIQTIVQTTTDDIAIRVSGLSKRYLIGGEKKGSLAETLSGMIGAKSNRKEEFWALQDINFEVKKGEVIGIIGKNGAGKSTLLKILSRITQPTSGKIEINGRVASLLEVGTGFHPELTGRENIFLNGTILGMSRQEVKDKFEEIVEFSGVQKFIDTPVKHYSSGMYVRLAFAVAAHLEPEILIIDEVLAVGDAEFQKKCLGKMKEVASKGRTVLFVSHNMAAVKSLCEKAILLEKGQMVLGGSTSDCIARYQGYNSNSTELSGPLLDIDEATIYSIKAKSFDTDKTIIDEYDEVILSTDIEVKKENSKLRVTYVLNNEEGESLFAFSEKDLYLKKGRKILECTFPKGFLNIGTFYLDIYLINEKYKTVHSEKGIASVSVIHGERPAGAWMGKEPGYIKPKFIWKELQYEID